MEPVELDIAQGYLLALTGSGKTGDYCRGKLDEYAGKDFREEFHLIEGLGDPVQLHRLSGLAIEARPGHYRAYYYRATAQGWQHRPHESVKHLTDAIRLNPRFYEAFSARAVFQSRLGKHAEAIEDHGRAIELNPKFGQALANRGVLRAQAGDSEGAMKDFTESIELDPYSVITFIHRGHLKRTLKDFEGAIEDYSSGIAVNPFDGEVRYLRGNAYVRQGKLAEAQVDFRKAMELTPENASAVSNLGLTYHMLSNNEPDKAAAHLEEAIAWYNDALKIGGGGRVEARCEGPKPSRSRRGCLEIGGFIPTPFTTARIPGFPGGQAEIDEPKPCERIRFQPFPCRD